MKKVLFYLFVFLFTISVHAQNTEQHIMLKNGLTYINTPYVAHTLEYGQQEKLVINKKEVDCTTFVEYTLAESLAEKDSTNDSSETQYLQKIRYRNGQINGYTSRLHYITEWIQEGIQNKFITDMTELHGPDSMYVALSYMSRHPQYYKHLSKSIKNRKAIKEIETKLSGQVIKWLPKDQLPEEGLPWIKEGDIIALTVGIYGLDISHMGIAIYQGDKLHLLHASSTKGKVVIEPIPLSIMLHRNKNWTGIRVLRPNLYPIEESNEDQTEIYHHENSKENIENDSISTTTNHVKS